MMLEPFSDQRWVDHHLEWSAQMAAAISGALIAARKLAGWVLGGIDRGGTDSRLP